MITWGWASTLRSSIVSRGRRGGCAPREWDEWHARSLACLPHDLHGQRSGIWRGPVRHLAMKILLIEDDAETRSHIASGLNEHGHAVDLASHGQSGLLMATLAAYDVIIVDRMLPGLDGIGLVRTARGAGL